jgi:Cdc6-like AAA superfamily ATPase
VWNDLNQPPYASFRNSSKLAKLETGTLAWLVHGEFVDHKPKFWNWSPSQQSLGMKDFTSWRDSNSSESLLVTAPPGQGKSVLSNFVVGHLGSRVPQEPPAAIKIIYYFCNIKNDEASRNANSILRALIVQLCEHQQRLFQTLP